MFLLHRLLIAVTHVSRHVIPDVIRFRKEDHGVGMLVDEESLLERGPLKNPGTVDQSWNSTAQLWQGVWRGAEIL